MKVQELIMNIHNKEFNLERGLQVKKYLPIEVKKTIASGILYESVTEDGGAIKIDSVQKYLSYVKYMITMHTNLEYSDADYDVICSTEYKDTNLLNAIIECFGEDAKECSRILNLVMDDYMQERSLEFSVSKFLNGLNDTINNIADKINKKVDNFDFNTIVPEDMDFNKLQTFLNQYIK